MRVSSSEPDALEQSSNHDERLLTPWRSACRSIAARSRGFTEWSTERGVFPKRDGNWAWFSLPSSPSESLVTKEASLWQRERRLSDRSEVLRRGPLGPVSIGLHDRPCLSVRRRRLCDQSRSLQPASLPESEASDSNSDGQRLLLRERRL